jgi:hypothetical protein
MNGLAKYRVNARSRSRDVNGEREMARPRPRLLPHSPHSDRPIIPTCPFWVSGKLLVTKTSNFNTVRWLM